MGGADNLIYNDRVMIYEQKKNIRRMKWLLFWVVVSQNVVYLIVEAIISFMPVPLHHYIRLAIIEILSVLIPLLVYRKDGGMVTRVDPKEQMKMRGFSIWQGVVVIILAASGQFIMVILNAPMTILQNILLPSSVTAAILPSSLGEIFLGMITIALIPAVLEEFLMRGIVYSALERQSTKVAVIFSALMFTVLHANIVECLGILFLGIMLGIVVMRTKSLYAAMLYHFTSNAVALCIGYLVRMVDTSYQMVIMFVAAIVIFLAAMFVFIMLTPSPAVSKSKNSAALLVRNIFSIPVLISIAVVIIVQYINIVQKIV